MGQEREMNGLEKQNSAIVVEANKILYDIGLLRVLGKYGRPLPWGSYVLGLMTWRDLDMYLETGMMTEDRFFQLGGEIASLVKPQRMHYRNELIGRTPGNPEGLYWGIYVIRPEFPEEWKIDVWAIDSKQLSARKKQFEDLKMQITPERRLTILDIKNHCWRHPEYRRGFSSMDIYRAVIEKNIKTIEGFAGWLKRDKGIIIDS
jgi:hypothetical protein